VARFSRREVEQQFAHLYYTGCVAEDWTGWADLFTDDCRYVEHFWGELHGRDEVRRWIDPVMMGVPEIYTVLEWYAIDDEKVVWALQNRRDNPDPDGPPYFDFAGLSVAFYAGDGRWAGEEDYWDVKGARATRPAPSTRRRS
jgi:limonene-1,2-epoxide hydrolase